jgi:hypothetical protein
MALCAPPSARGANSPATRGQKTDARGARPPNGARGHHDRADRGGTRPSRREGTKRTATTVLAGPFAVQIPTNSHEHTRTASPNPQRFRGYSPVFAAVRDPYGIGAKGPGRLREAVSHPFAVRSQSESPPAPRCSSLVIAYVLRGPPLTSRSYAARAVACCGQRTVRPTRRHGHRIAPTKHPPSVR